ADAHHNQDAHGHPDGLGALCEGAPPCRLRLHRGWRRGREVGYRGAVGDGTDLGHGHGVEIRRADVEVTEVAEPHGQVDTGLRTDLDVEVQRLPLRVGVYRVG